MKINFSLKNNNNYIALTVALVATYWVLTFFENSIALSKGITNSSVFELFFYKLINDFWAGILIALLFYPLYILLISLKEKAGKICTYAFFVSLVLIQTALIKYSSLTLVPLGADLLGYSLHDIQVTVSSSVSFSFFSMVPFIVFPLIFVGLNWLAQKWVQLRSFVASAIIIILVFGSLKLVLSKTSEKEFQNKSYFLAKDIINYKIEAFKNARKNFSSRTDYPLLRPANEIKDVLGPYFTLNKDVKPNIVIIMVEGLGDEFVGGNTYSGFTPYIDSLIPKSLYWKNFVSNAGRTFGVLPSLTASLPFGDNGFMELKEPPGYISLISILKANGYTTTYYSGDESSFDRKINFLEYNEIDDVLDEDKYGPDYKKTAANSGGFSWGYPDEEIFRKMESMLDAKKQPRLDIVMTLTNHEPFTFPTKKEYITAIKNKLNSNYKFNTDKKDFTDNIDIFACLAYTDKSIEDFMKAYAKRPEYNNTIFVITGDHRLIPISQKDKLCRFHVPLLIYSPMLKKPETFKSVSSHWDVTPSLVSLLANNYKFNEPEKVAWISDGLDTVQQFRNTHKIAFMRYKGGLNDYMYKNYLLSDGDLYKINQNFGTIKVVNEQMKDTLTTLLSKFKDLNTYVTKYNKIYPDSLNIYVRPVVRFTDKEKDYIAKNTKGLTYDEVFFKARELAFNKKRKEARILLKYILNELPNYADARTLKARTLAWDGDYKDAEAELVSVIQRSPYYTDAYAALFDVFWWSNQDDKAVALYKKARANDLTDSELSFKMAKAFKRLNEPEKAKQMMDSIVKIYPTNKDYVTFKKTLN